MIHEQLCIAPANPFPLRIAASLAQGASCKVVLDDLLRHLVIRLQDLVLARREGAHPPASVLIPRRLVGLEVEALLLEPS
jgi:hypothetical protein